MLQIEAMSQKDHTPQANIAPFGLRMQPDLKARIEAAARQNERSMNAEIVSRLQESFAVPHMRALLESHEEVAAINSELLDSYKRQVENFRRRQEQSDKIEYFLEWQLLNVLIAIQAAADGDTKLLDDEVRAAASSPHDIAGLRAKMRKQPNSDKYEAELDARVQALLQKKQTEK